MLGQDATATQESGAPAEHGWLSSALYRMVHFGRGRPRGRSAELPRAETHAAREPNVTVLHIAHDYAEQADGPSPVPAEPAPDGGAELVDPLERTRALLANARRRMPGMLGMRDDEPLPPAAAPPPSPLTVAERLAAEWREALVQVRADQQQFIAELRSELHAEMQAGIQLLVDDFAEARREFTARLEAERERLAAEVVELRSLLGGLQGEVARLRELPVDQQTQDAIGAVPEYRPQRDEVLPVGTFHLPKATQNAPELHLELDEAGAEVVSYVAMPPGMTGDHEDVAEPRFVPKREVEDAEPDAPIVATAAQPEDLVTWQERSSEADDQVGATRTLPARSEAPGWRDFGWRSRPEAFDAQRAPVEAGDAGAAVGAEMQGSDSVLTPAFPPSLSVSLPILGERSLGEGTGDEIGALSAGQPQNRGGTEHEDPRLRTDEAARPVLGEIRLAVGPVLGVRRLSALEQRLAACPGVSHHELVSYRGGEAQFRLYTSASIETELLLDAVTDAAGAVGDYMVEDGGRHIQVRLSPVAGDSPA